MANGNEQLNRLLLRYRQLAGESLGRIYQARSEVRARNYTPTSFISDAWDLWLNAVDWMYVPFEADVLRIEMAIHQGTTQAVGQVRMDNPGPGSYARTALRPVYTGASPIPASTTGIDYDNGVGLLIADVTGIPANQDVDLYQGDVLFTPSATMVQTAIATIYLAVVP